MNRSTGFTPNSMMLGREFMMPLDFMLGSAGKEAGVHLGQILRIGGWRHIKKQGKFGRGPKETEKVL